MWGSWHLEIAGSRKGWLNFAGRMSKSSSRLLQLLQRKEMSHHHKAAEGAIREKRLGNEGPVLPDQRDADAVALDEKRIPFKDVPLQATVDTASERDLTFGTMLRGTAANRLTVFERKAALINAWVPGCRQASFHYGF